MDRRILASCAAAIVAALLLAACAPSPVTTEGRQVKGLYDLFMIAAVAIFAMVAGLIAWSLLRYRARGSHELPPQTRANVPLEVAWWALPTLLVIGLFVATVQVLNAVDAPPAADPLTLKVEGFQWQWRFTYAKSGVELIGTPGALPEVMLPTGRPIRFELGSADVIHSFYVPRFLIKRDAIPGINNAIELTIDEEGRYTGQCAEFCGLLHDQMGFTIVAVSPAAFDAWLTQREAGS